MTNTLITQFIGAIGYTSLALSYFKKKKKDILFIEIIAYIFFTLHYYLLNGITGTICNFIGLLALVTIYFFDKYKLSNKIFNDICYYSFDNKYNNISKFIFYISNDSFYNRYNIISI